MERRTIAWVITVVVFVMLVAASLAASDGAGSLGGESTSGYSGSVDRDDGLGAADVAIVPVIGSIVDGSAASGSGMVGGDDVTSLIEQLVEDEVSAIVLEIDSPGGAVIASDDIAGAVAEARAAGIPVVAWMRSAAASGGYYVAAQADHIIAHPATITGSIGVILSYPNIGELSDDIGVEWIVVKSGALKDIGSPFRSLTQPERNILQALIDEAYERFVGVVAEGRDMPDSEVRTLADGRIYTGQQAFDNGLVDELGGEDEVLAKVEELVGSDLRITRYQQEFSFADLFAVDSPLAAGAPDAAELLEELRRSGTPSLEYRATL